MEDMYTFSGLLFTAIAIFWAVYTYKRQMNAQLFLEYTSRYDQIMQSYKSRIIDLDIDSDSLPEVTGEVDQCLLRYLNLCSEEYYLWKRGYLNDDIWLIWEGEIKRSLNSELYKRAWVVLQNEFQAFPEFSRYVKEVQSES